MKRNLILMAVATVMSVNAVAQNVASADSVAADSLDALVDRFVNLGEVTVTGASVVNKSDRKWIIPSENSKNMAADGCDLVKKLQMPDVRVDAVSGAISMFSNGNLKLCINGRPVSDKDIRAIDPKTVVRVEYHDNPSLRFGGADLVLDFIVKVPNSGGRFGMMGQIVPLKGTEFQYRPDLEINYKKSTFRINGYNEQFRGFKQWRENYENYTLADGSQFTRTESGIPADLNNNHYWGSAEYMYFEQEKDLFSVSVDFNGDRNPHQDYVGTLTSTLDGGKVLLRDMEYESYFSPSLNVYYQHNFAKNKLLMMNVVAGCDRNRTYRDYTEQDMTDESGNGDLLVDVKNDMRSRGKSLMGEIDYEQRWRSSRLSVGGSFQYGWSKSRYLSYDKIERMRNSSTYLYSQWWQSLGQHFDATFGVGAYLKYYAVVGSDDVSKWTFVPRLNLRYRINGKNTLRLNYTLYSKAPTLSQLSSVRQQVDGLQQSEGNAALKTYSSHFVKLSYEYSHKRFYGQFEFGYTYESNPIGQQKSWVDGMVLSTYANQRDFQDLLARGTLRYEVIPEWVSASGSLTWRRYMSHGNNYNHTLSDVRGNASLEVTHWNFGFQLQMETRGKILEGESVEQMSSNGMVVALSYQWRGFQFVGACINPFTGDYKEETKNLNPLAGYRRVAHRDFLSKCLLFQVHYNISWGRKYESGDRRINNSLERGGVSAAGK